MVEVVDIDGADKMVRLRIGIYGAEDIDRDTKDPNGDKRLYLIYFWVDPNIMHWTRVAEGLPDPAWNRVYSVPLGKSPTYEYLYLEIYRVFSKSDPGTSCGEVLVGRTKISLPKETNCKQNGRYVLAAPKGTGSEAKGLINIAMEMRYQEDDEIALIGTYYG